jgi:serine/threonine protein kinase
VLRSGAVVAAPLTPEDVPAVELAELVLWAAAVRDAPAVLVTPAGETHTIAFDEGSLVREVLHLTSALGDAVAARLAVIADLDVAAEGEQMRRLKLRAGDHELEVLVAVRGTDAGLAAEIRRLMPPASRATDAPISRLGVYRIEGELGRGGMGLVYRATHEALGRHVAVKVLFAELAREPDVSARFVREARAASRARHPGIVDVFDFGTLPDGRAFLVMELVDGPTLQKILTGGALTPGRSLDLARQIVEALGAAHRAGVVHRDLKPANVFLTAGDHVKLGDFGAAKLLGAAASPADTQEGGHIVGTPHYMSPEHARGLPTDRRTDLYATGCVLFEMLTGVVPFDGETPVDVLTKHIVAPIPIAESPHGALPEAIQRLIRRSLAKRAEERYQTADEMRTDLERAAAALERPGWRKWLPL